MPRPSGARNHDFDEKRANLLDTLTEFAVATALKRPSLRQFALAARQSEPTLRHYFGDRQGLVIEIIKNIGARARIIWASVAAPASDPPAALSKYLRMTEAGLSQHGYARTHAFGLIEGLADPVVGKVYLEVLLEPSLQAFSDKLSATPGGPKDPDTLRAASLAATGPLFLLGLHQELLNGRETLPINVEPVFRHLNNWLGSAFTPAPES